MFIPVVVMVLLLDKALGQQENIFMAKYKDAIQEYIMIGHEEGWQQCDILSSNPSHDGVPQLSMDLETINKLNIKAAFKYSHCLLVNYGVSSEASLSTLLEFGLKAMNHVRLALVIKMSSGITLETATNTSSLPYLVVAESDSGMEQFLCPVVGGIKPRLGNEMCNPTYLDYKCKALRVGLLGVPPDLILTSTGVEGTNTRLIKMLAEKLKFMPNIKFARSFKLAENQVCKVLD